MAASSIALLKELSATPTCLTFRELRVRLGWNARRTRAAVAALKSQNAVDAPRLDCFRCNKIGKAMLKAAQEKADQPRKNPPRRPANPKSLRTRVWRVLRVLGKATVQDIMVNVGTPEEQQDEERLRYSVQTYLANLCTGGYVQRMAKRDAPIGPGKRGAIRYLLLPEKNTGPFSPRIGVGGAVYDPNRREVTWRPEGAQ